MHPQWTAPGGRQEGGDPRGEGTETDHVVCVSRESMNEIASFMCCVWVCGLPQSSVCSIQKRVSSALHPYHAAVLCPSLPTTTTTIDTILDQG